MTVYWVQSHLGIINTTSAACNARNSSNAFTAKITIGQKLVAGLQDGLICSMSERPRQKPRTSTTVERQRPMIASLIEPNNRTPLIHHKRLAPSIPPLVLCIADTRIPPRRGIIQQTRLGIMTIQTTIDRMIITQTQQPARPKVQRFDVVEVAAEIVGEHLVGDEEAVAAVVDAGGITAAAGLGVDFELEVAGEGGTGVETQSLRAEVAGWEFGGGS